MTHYKERRWLVIGYCRRTHNFEVVDRALNGTAADAIAAALRMMRSDGEDLSAWDLCAVDAIGASQKARQSITDLLLRVGVPVHEYGNVLVGIGNMVLQYLERSRAH